MPVSKTPSPVLSNSYRYPTEQAILWITLFLVFTVIAFTATATVCLSLVFIVGYIGLAYLSTRAHHQSLIRSAIKIDGRSSPRLNHLINECQQVLRPGLVEVFVARRNAMNAYTFGIRSPKTVVLYAPVLERLDPVELKFVIGHELGHVRLGHTWLNTLVGGMAGIPSPNFAFALLNLTFRSWNRACEYSADRAGLHACGEVRKAISALVKIEAGVEGDTQSEWQQAAIRIDAQDDTWFNNLSEMLQTHPMTIKRIHKLISYSKSQFR